MILPQTVTIDFLPVDDGQLATIEITPAFKCGNDELLELLRFAAAALEEAIGGEG